MPYCGYCLNLKMKRGWRKVHCAEGNLTTSGIEDWKEREPSYLIQRTGIIGDRIGYTDRGKDMKVLNPEVCCDFNDMRETANVV